MIMQGFVLEEYKFDEIFDDLVSQQKEIAVQKLMALSEDEEKRFWEYFIEGVQRDYKDIENLSDYIDELELIFLIENLRRMGKTLNAKELSEEEISKRFELIALRAAEPAEPDITTIQRPLMVSSYNTKQSEIVRLIPSTESRRRYVDNEDGGMENSDGDTCCCRLF